MPLKGNLVSAYGNEIKRKRDVPELHSDSTKIIAENHQKFSPKRPSNVHCLNIKIIRTQLIYATCVICGLR